MKTFNIICPNHRRPEILRLWCAGIKRLREELNYDFGAVVVSGAEDEELCHSYNVWHETMPNRPITAKFNRACLIGKKERPDYTIITGSDNLISTSTLKCIITEMEKGYDLIGVDSIYFYDSDGGTRGTLTHLHGKRIMGVGKCISSKVMDKVDWMPWSIPRNWGMDWVASQTIMPHVETAKVLEGQKVFDIKSQENINKFRTFPSRLEKCDPQILFDCIGEEEAKLIKGL
jgi:hypothetical protein